MAALECQLAGALQGREAMIQEHERSIKEERSRAVSAQRLYDAATGRVSELENELAALSARLTDASAALETAD